ncbi:MAG: hypothetical protein C0502_09390 [Opitutus sp.]|nr:hypothetical protein [Opitutus sp.]
MHRINNQGTLGEFPGGKRKGGPPTPKRPAIAFLVTPKLPLGGRSEKLDCTTGRLFRRFVNSAGCFRLRFLFADSACHKNKHLKFCVEMLCFNEIETTSAVFRIRGPDANTFLNGQFSQELRSPTGHSAYGLWLNPKGKVIADSTVLRLADDEHLVFASTSDPVQLRQRWEDYLVADEVTIADETGRWGALLLWGDGLASAVTQLSGASFGTAGFLCADGAHLFPAWGGRGARCWLICAYETKPAWQAKLARLGAHAADANTAALARIRDGIPAVPDDIGPDDLPNEGGLETTAISYTKGCYLGQEVMSRLKNLGQVRRKLHVLRGDGAPPAPRTALFQSGRRVGETRSAAADGDGFAAFAMLSLVSLDPAAPLQLGENGPVVEILRRG